MTMNVMSACTENYLSRMLVMLVSLCENNKDHIDFYLFHSNSISEIAFRRFSSKLEKYDITIIECNHPEFRNADFLQSANVGVWVVESYIRLIAFKYLPQKVKRILYLDGDIIINGNIKLFYNSDFEYKSIIASPDTGMLGAKEGISYNMRMEGREYVNAGVLLMNIDRMRDIYKEEQILDVIKNLADRITHADQDVLNLFFREEVKVVSNKYNCIVAAEKMDEKRILKEMVILHYASVHPENSFYGKNINIYQLGILWWKYARLANGNMACWAWTLKSRIIRACYLLLHYIKQSIKRGIVSKNGKKNI